MKFYIPKLKHKYIKSQHFQSFKKGGLIPIFQNPSSALPIIEIPKELITSDWFPQNLLSKAEQAIIDNELNKPVWIPREVNPNTDRNLNDMISKGVNKSLKLEAIQTLRSKTPAELKKIQKELADKGYYDEYIKDVKKLQLRLIELGYLSDAKREDGSYVEVDGIAGKKTKAAFRKSQIDGILGSKTINAYIKSARDYMLTIPQTNIQSRRLGGTVYIKEKNKSACKYYTGGSVNLPEVVITPKSKGERYGNPLNIERRKKENGEYVKWEGSVEHNPDPRYEQFNTVYDGFRAGFKTLNTYNKKGFNTVSSIINRWAPNHENPTNNYIKFVSDKLDVDPNLKLDFNEETLISLAQAMSKFETGVDFDRNTIQKGYQLYKTK